LGKVSAKYVGDVALTVKVRQCRGMYITVRVHTGCLRQTQTLIQRSASAYSIFCLRLAEAVPEVIRLADTYQWMKQGELCEVCRSSRGWFYTCILSPSSHLSDNIKVFSYMLYKYGYKSGHYVRRPCVTCINLAHISR
jgi:hypothetical protein